LKNDNPFIIPTSISIPSLFGKPSYPTVPLELHQREGVYKEICEKTEISGRRDDLDKRKTHPQ
jgi:hypothetical protein